MVSDVVSNKLASVTTTKLDSETRTQLWKTSTQPIKNFKSVNYGGDHLNDEIIERNGDTAYVEHPVTGSAANIVLMKGQAKKLNDFLNIQNPMKGDSKETLVRHEETRFPAP